MGEQVREDGVPEARHRRVLCMYLRGRDVACPACGYSLRDCAHGRCPECGHEPRLVLEPVRPSRVVIGTVGLCVWLCVFVVMSVGALAATAAGHASLSALGVLPTCLLLAIAADQWWARQRELRRLNERRRIMLVVACWVGPMLAMGVLYGALLLGE